MRSTDQAHSCARLPGVRGSWWAASGVFPSPCRPLRSDGRAQAMTATAKMSPLMNRLVCRFMAFPNGILRHVIRMPPKEKRPDAASGRFHRCGGKEGNHTKSGKSRRDPGFQISLRTSGVSEVLVLKGRAVGIPHAPEKWIHFSDKGLRKKDKIYPVAGILTATGYISPGTPRSCSRS